jgi:hypothetical protein
MVYYVCFATGKMPYAQISNNFLLIKKSPPTSGGFYKILDLDYNLNPYAMRKAT